MNNYDDVTKENINEHNPNSLRILDYPSRILIIRGSGSGKTNALLNLIKTKMMMIVVLLIRFKDVKDVKDVKDLRMLRIHMR